MAVSPALLVIDEQVGAFDGKLVPAIHEGDLLLTKTRTLIDAARTSAVPVVFIQHCASEGLLIQGTEAWEIHPAIRPDSNETTVLKQESSAFKGTDLEDILNAAAINTVIICGLQSEHCVSNTSFNALDLGFTVYVAHDCHSTWPNEENSASAIIMRQNEALGERGAILASANELVDLLKS